MADRYQLTIGSTTADKTEASKQLNLARQEWNDYLSANRTYDTINGISVENFPNGWRMQAEPKLQEILQKYPYVTTYTDTGRLVTDRLAIKTDGSIQLPNAPKIPSNQGTVPNRDDAYPVIGGGAATPKPVTGTAHPSDPSKIQAGATGTRTTDGSAATDAPGLQGAQQRPNQGSTAAPSNGTAPPSGTSDATPSAANSTGPSTGSGEQGTQTTTTDPNREGSGTSNSATPKDDDQGSTTGTGDDTQQTPGGSGNSTVNTNAGQPGTGTGTGANQTPLNRKIKVQPNILHSYVNWTYQIGFYMLDPGTYNEFVLSGSEGQSSNLRSRPIFRSGGFKKSGSGMKNDLYVSRLRTSGVIGNNNASPNANLFSIEMSVVEPYGANMLAELKRMADEMGGDQQHLQLPYLLEIKFLGYDDSGKIVTNIKDSGPKLIPVQLIGITFNITGAGTTYNMTMVPFSQVALNTQFGVIRERLQLYGQDLKEILVEGRNSLAESLTVLEQAAKRNGECEYPDEYKFVVKSFGPNNSPNDELLNSKVTFDFQGVNATEIYKRGTSSPTAAGPTDAPVNDPNKKYFEIQGGSNIKDAVQKIVMQSKYFQDRVVPNADDSLKDKPMELIKVIPVVVLGEFDKLRRRYQRTVTYKVTTYFRYGEINPYVGQATVDKGLIAKDYNWLFTGKNQDIIDINLQYNLVYFNIFQKNSPMVSSALSGANTIEDKAPPQNPPANDSYFDYPTQSGQLPSYTLRGAKDTAVQEYMDQQLNNPNNADLVSLEMDIIGDPDWIPQDLSVRPRGDDVEISSDGFINGSIATDAESVYARIKFKTPRDYSDTTGLMELTQDQTSITGVYLVYMVESVFEGGLFKQTLRMVRAKNQTENKPASSNTPSSGGARDFNEIARRNAAFDPQNLRTYSGTGPGTSRFQNSNNVNVNTPAANPGGALSDDGPGGFDALGNFTGG